MQKLLERPVFCFVRPVLVDDLDASDRMYFHPLCMIGVAYVGKPRLRGAGSRRKVAAAVKKLKERGLVSPYLRSFVVARINPLRWIKAEPLALEDVLKTMRERATKFNVEKINQQDLAGAAGPPDEET